MPGQVTASPRKPRAGAGQGTGTYRPADRPQTPAGCPAVALAMRTSSEDKFSSLLGAGQEQALHRTLECWLGGSGNAHQEYWPTEANMSIQKVFCLREVFFNPVGKEFTTFPDFSKKANCASITAER